MKCFNSPRGKVWQKKTYVERPDGTKSFNSPRGKVWHMARLNCEYDFLVSIPQGVRSGVVIKTTAIAIAARFNSPRGKVWQKTGCIDPVSKWNIGFNSPRGKVWPWILSTRRDRERNRFNSPRGKVWQRKKCTKPTKTSRFNSPRGKVWQVTLRISVRMISSRFQFPKG